jgi:hypothetical protein
MAVGLAIVPLYAEYFIFSLSSSSRPVHSGQFVKLLATKYGITSSKKKGSHATVKAREDAGKKEYRATFHDLDNKKLDENGLIKAD